MIDVQAALAAIDRLESRGDRIAAYRKLVAERPGLSVAWFNVATELLRDGRHDEARDAALRAIALDPSHRQVLSSELRDAIERPTLAPTKIAPLDVALTLRVGKHLGRYQILRLDSVNDSYATYDGVSDQGQPVSVRVLLQLSNNAAGRLFALQRELPSESCLPTITILQDGDVPLQVIERLSAPTLWTWLAQRDRTQAESVAAIAAVALVVAALRSARADVAIDVRPELVSWSGDRPARLLGVAPFAGDRTLLVDDAANEWRLQRPALPGSPRADVESLGLLLYYALTLCRPPRSLREDPTIVLRDPMVPSPQWAHVLHRCLVGASEDAIGAASQLATLLTTGEEPSLSQSPVAAAGAGNNNLPPPIANWRPLRILGEGSFGVVYEAEDTRLPGRRAALKVMRAGTPGLDELLVREVQAAATAAHPNIVQIFDFGVAPEGSRYVAMELLIGRSLATYLAERPGQRIDAAELRALGVPLCLALESAHRRGVVHRDLKPDNVFLVEQSGAPLLPKLVDFGIAKLRGGPALGGRTLTDGKLVGTCEFMAPEQWRAEPDVDGGADVYALGVMFHYALCGRLPYSADSIYEWAKRHCEAPIPELPETVPIWLRELVRKMMVKHRAERATIEEVIRQLQHVEPTRSGAGSWKPIALVAAGLAVAAVVGVLGYEAYLRSQRTVTSPTTDDLARLSPPVTNRWVRVEPASSSIILGVPDGARDSGLRPGRNVTAPRAAFEIQQHELAWRDLSADERARFGPVPADDRLPVTGVDWMAANAYCTSHGARLPSEAEIEWAMRGPALRPHTWGTTRIVLTGETRTCVFEGNEARPAPVMTCLQDKTPGDPAIYDLEGNVQEWTRDRFLSDAVGTDDSWVTAGGRDHAVIRGLPLYAPLPRELPNVGATVRASLCSKNCSSDLQRVLPYVGFRCVRDPEHP